MASTIPGGMIQPLPADGVISGWYLSCDVKGYNIFCLNLGDPLNTAGAETYCLYVDNDRGELMWYSRQSLPLQNVFLPAQTFTTGIYTQASGWHFFAVIYKSFDNHNDEIVRTDLQIYFGGESLWTGGTVLFKT
jgi:hypothetical protein